MLSQKASSLEELGSISMVKMEKGFKADYVIAELYSTCVCLCWTAMSVWDLRL